MSAFTFTAPIVTPEDERAEREALSEEDRQRLEEDLFGTSTSSAVDGNDNEHEEGPTDDEMHNAMVSMQTALDQIPDKEKIEYLEALERAPELVQIESDATKFLLFTKLDAEAAARRLVEYWKVRLTLFGKDRCYLPMTLAGAMAEDMEALQKGLFFELEPDAHGRAVFYLDRMRCIKEVAHRDAINRCFWYLVQTHLQKTDGLNNNKGTVFLINYRGYDLYKHFDRIMTKKWFWTVNVQPIVIKAIHFCRGPGSSVSDIVLPVIKKMLDRYMRLRMIIHSGSNSEILQDMEDYGFNKNHVDRFFDGLISNGVVAQRWLDERRQIESTKKEQAEAVCDAASPVPLATIA